MKKEKIVNIEVFWVGDDSEWVLLRRGEFDKIKQQLLDLGSTVKTITNWKDEIPT